MYRRRQYELYGKAMQRRCDDFA